MKRIQEMKERQARGEHFKKFDRDGGAGRFGRDGGQRGGFGDNRGGYGDNRGERRRSYQKREN